MVANSALLDFSHPLRYLPRSEKIYLARDGVTELDRSGYGDKEDRKPRPFLVAILDPLDISGLIIGKDGEMTF